jgi:deoxycytidylate deaminase
VERRDEERVVAMGSNGRPREVRGCPEQVGEEMRKMEKNLGGKFRFAFSFWAWLRNIIILIVLFTVQTTLNLSLVAFEQ